MSDNGNKSPLKQVSTYLREDDDLYQAVLSEAKDTGLAFADIIRLALSDRYERQRAEWEARRFAPDQVPATP